MAEDQSNKYIIVSDDNNFFAGVIKGELVSRGYEVDIAQNGKIAIELAEKRKPVLMLLDLIMPVQDGFDTLKKLKANSNLKDIKVVVFSNLSQQKDVEEVTKLGAVGYIIKQDLSIEETMADILKHLPS